MPDYLESMHKIENIIQDKNIRWVYGSHNGILPDKEMIYETTDFFEEVMDGKREYIVVEGLRFYELNEFISLLLPLE